MRKNIMCMLLVLVMMTIPCALAEQVAPTAVPSINVSIIVTPATPEIIYEEGFAIWALPVEPETKQAELQQEIIEFVQEQSVATYFGEEIMAAAASILPEEFDVETLVMDEFVSLVQQSYEEEYGDVTVAFEFATEYKEEDVLLVMVGILPTEEELAADASATPAPTVTIDPSATLDPSSATPAPIKDENSVIWYLVPAAAVEGKVQMILSSDALIKMGDHSAVMLLLRGDAVIEPAGTAAPQA